MADVALPVELHALIREGSDLLDLALCLLDLAVELGADLVELRPDVVHLAIQRPQRAMEAVEPFVGIVGEVRGDGGREEHQGIEGEQRVRHLVALGRDLPVARELRGDIRVAEQADRVERGRHHHRRQDADQEVAQPLRNDVPHVDADEHADQRNGDGQRRGHHIRQVLRFTEEAEDDGVQRELADRQERDQRPVKDSWEDDHRIPPQLRRAHLVGLGDRPDAALELVELALVRLDDRPKLGDPARGGLEDLLHGLLAIRDQRLLEWSGRVGAHLRNVALAVLLPFGGDAALVREFRQRRRLSLRERDIHDRYASCFLRTELSSWIINFTLYTTAYSVS